MSNYECYLVQAGDWDDDEYQEYYYEHSGERVPEGEDVGVEIVENGETRFYLLDHVRFP